MVLKLLVPWCPISSQQLLFITMRDFAHFRGHEDSSHHYPTLSCRQEEEWPQHFDRLQSKCSLLNTVTRNLGLRSYWLFYHILTHIVRMCEKCEVRERKEALKSFWGFLCNINLTLKSFSLLR